MSWLVPVNDPQDTSLVTQDHLPPEAIWSPLSLAGLVLYLLTSNFPCFSCPANTLLHLNDPISSLDSRGYLGKRVYLLWDGGPPSSAPGANLPVSSHCPSLLTPHIKTTSTALLCRCSNSNKLFCFWKLSQISIMDFLNQINQDKEFPNSAYFSSPARSSVNLACEPCIVSAAFCPRHHNSKGLPSVKTPWRRERQSHSLAESVIEHHITSRGGGGAYGVIIERLQHKRELLWCSMWC